jgi:soluble lytic murein transglycosylase-like protein
MNRILLAAASFAVLATCIVAVPGCQSSRDRSAATHGEPRIHPARDALAADIAGRYETQYESARFIIDEAYLAAGESALDPLLILAVIGVESRFEPAARNPSGAQGLMQIIPKFHLQKLAAHGGANAILDPVVNIRVGAVILADYIARGGSVEAGLQRYVGAGDDPARSYARKVLAERARLQAVAARSG